MKRNLQFQKLDPAPYGSCVAFCVHIRTKKPVDVNLLHRPGSYQFSLVLFAFPPIVFEVLAFLFSWYFAAPSLSNLISTVVYFFLLLYWHLLCFEEMTKKVIANQYIL